MVYCKIWSIQASQLSINKLADNRFFFEVETRILLQMSNVTRSLDG